MVVLSVTVAKISVIGKQELFSRNSCSTAEPMGVYKPRREFPICGFGQQSKLFLCHPFSRLSLDFVVIKSRLFPLGNIVVLSLWHLSGKFLKFGLMIQYRME